MTNISDYSVTVSNIGLSNKDPEFIKDVFERLVEALGEKYTDVDFAGFDIKNNDSTNLGMISIDFENYLRDLDVDAYEIRSIMDDLDRMIQEDHEFYLEMDYEFYKDVLKKLNDELYYFDVDYESVNNYDDEFSTVITIKPEYTSDYMLIGYDEDDLDTIIPMIVCHDDFYFLSTFSENMNAYKEEIEEIQDEYGVSWEEFVEIWNDTKRNVISELEKIKYDIEHPSV